MQGKDNKDDPAPDDQSKEYIPPALTVLGNLLMPGNAVAQAS